LMITKSQGSQPFAAKVGRRTRRQGTCCSSRSTVAAFRRNAAYLMITNSKGSQCFAENIGRRTRRQGIRLRMVICVVSYRPEGATQASPPQRGG
ncbi:MAG: hypothetical protein LBP87_09910, partial [Planctomycetaceae bacterium]|nr:hypothetical protein [Planctomycetaceae bacterium]